MNCREFWNTMPLRGQEFTEEQSRHVAECSACAAQWEPHRALAAGLLSLAEEWRRAEAPARVELGLAAAFRAHTGFQVRRPVRLTWWTPVFAWASAAAAMIALGAILVHGYQPATREPGTVATPHRVGRPSVETAALRPLVTVEDDADDDASFLGDGFVRLPNAPRLEPDEHVDLVRYEVPGSDIIALGLAVSEERASEPVLAEFALASDGTARAVRFVNPSGTF
jgi:hypothetical protein